MTHKKSKLLAVACLTALLFAASPVSAAVVTVTKVGTWSSAPNAPNPGMLAQGGKFVIMAAVDGVINPTANARLFRSELTAPGSFTLWVPIQGTGNVAMQTEADHLPVFTPTAQIQYFDAAGTQFRGFEFSSNPALPGTSGLPGGGLYFDIFTSDTIFTPGTTVTNSTAHISNGDGGFGIDISSATQDVLTEDAVSTSGGLQKPGVFLSDAVPVVAEAGGNLAYSASTLTVTTNGGTAVVVDPVDPIVPGDVRGTPSASDAQPRQADNDLGAGRTDGEDFLAYAWTVDGAALVGTNTTGNRINRVVMDSPAGPVFVNEVAPRTVDDVNKTVAIANSGLTKTTDVKTWKVDVTEDMTGKTGSDTITVSYTNALPTIANATANASGPGNLNLDFALSIDDADLALNASIAAFEELMKELSVDGIDSSLFFADLLNTGSQSVDNAALISAFGVGAHTFMVKATDRAGASAQASFDFNVLASTMPPNNNVPEPSSLALIGIAVAGLVVSIRRRPLARERS